MKLTVLVLFVLNASLLPAPASAQDSLQLTSLVAGWAHTCGLTKDGRAYCWGWDAAGGLGIGDTVVSTTPVAVTGGLTFTVLAASLLHTCGLTPDGAAYCWGWNDDGQLGVTTSERCSKMKNSPCSAKALPVSGGLVFTTIAAGFQHSCALTPSGHAYCWGANNKGQLGDGTATARRATRTVATDLTFAALVAGGQYTCGLASTGTPYCWGANQNGQLGNATGSDSGLPARVVAATTTPSPIPALKLPGATLADDALQRDTQNYLLTVGAALATDMSCPHSRVINTEVVKKPRNVQVRDGRMVRGEWAERWTVDFCGKFVAFRIEYSADGSGGVNFSAQAQ